MEISINNLDFSDLDEKLNHLSKEQIVEIITAYYDGDKIKDLLERYEIKTTTSNLVRIFPPILSGEHCIKCESPIVMHLESRSSSNYFNNHQKYCSSCGHQEISFCSCEFCKKERMEAKRLEEERQKKLLEKKRQLLCDYYEEDNWEMILETDLSLEDRLYLAVVLRGALSEDTSYIEPLENIEGKIAPTTEYEREIIKTLTGRNILVPSLKSKVDDFEVEFVSEDDQQYKIAYYIYKVHYRLNVMPEDDDYDAMIKRLLYPHLNDEEGFKDFCYEKWRQVALNECLQYLLYQMHKVGYTFNPGEKTIRVFEELLEHFSVSQIYSIIYRSVANSTQRYQAREITKIHAQNSVIASCESYGQRAIAQGWKLTYYARLRDLPETYISNVLFTSIMQIAELGFSEKPTPDF
ncbi:hypothetical protein J1P26_22330 [Neobacillus sp. MM2021_6]|uniref:hypothetical protein n=1 Tax=Bacillaceae TaxID=186817 RepID=UPI00140A794F|nr:MULTISPECIES: hypothetical protein [Bacillaceae]MBO0962442.1 hypothetical protein [Neobacillus sp. MM2021_6]NHC21432.1 hypothetical protein [Bacillus sp. MM2020_4]